MQAARVKAAQKKDPTVTKWDFINEGTKAHANRMQHEANWFNQDDSKKVKDYKKDPDIQGLLVSEGGKLFPSTEVLELSAAQTYITVLDKELIKKGIDPFDLGKELKILGTPTCKLSSKEQIILPVLARCMKSLVHEYRGKGGDGVIRMTTDGEGGGKTVEAKEVVQPKKRRRDSSSTSSSSTSSKRRKKSTTRTKYKNGYHDLGFMLLGGRISEDANGMVHQKVDSGVLGAAQLQQMIDDVIALTAILPTAGDIINVTFLNEAPTLCMVDGDAGNLTVSAIDGSYKMAYEFDPVEDEWEWPTMEMEIVDEEEEEEEEANVNGFGSRYVQNLKN